MTKKTFLLPIFLTFALFASAQESNGYYFKDFTNGQVLLKNKQFARGKFNYDFANRQMHFLNGNTDMIVDNLQDIDTIIIDKTRFVPYDGRFMEIMKGEKSVILIEKEVNTSERGKVGAMGVATHGSVQAIDVNARFQRVNGENNMDMTIYKALPLGDDGRPPLPRILHSQHRNMGNGSLHCILSLLRFFHRRHQLKPHQPLL